MYVNLQFVKPACRLITYWPARSMLTHSKKFETRIARQKPAKMLSPNQVLTHAARAAGGRARRARRALVRAKNADHCIYRAAGQICRTSAIRRACACGWTRFGQNASLFVKPVRRACARGWIFGKNALLTHVPSGRAQRERNAVLLA